MKRFFTLAVVAAMLFAVQAQQLRVGEVKMLSGTEKGGYYHPVFSPTGDYLITSSEDYVGIVKHNLQDGKQIRLTDAAGAGYGVRISADGKHITANRYEWQGNLRYSAIDRIDVKDGKTVNIRRMSRQQTDPVTETEKVYVTTNGFEMTVHNGQTESVIRPNGDESYFWCSVSPDGKHIMYVTAHHGAQVCNIDGTNPVFMGIMNAPQWIDNENVVAMRDVDDGDFIVESKLVVRNINNPRQVETLETGQKIAMYPSVSADGKHIAFNNNQGQIFIMEVQK